MHRRPDRSLRVRYMCRSWKKQIFILLHIYILSLTRGILWNASNFHSVVCLVFLFAWGWFRKPCGDGKICSGATTGQMDGSIPPLDMSMIYVSGIMSENFSQIGCVQLIWRPDLTAGRSTPGLLGRPEPGRYHRAGLKNNHVYHNFCRKIYYFMLNFEKIWRIFEKL